MTCAAQGGIKIDVDFRIYDRLFSLERHNSKRQFFQLRISEDDTHQAGIKEVARVLIC